jgi:prepilin-type N-terminal cleavage/methylation domain-containing protein
VTSSVNHAYKPHGGTERETTNMFDVLKRPRRGDDGFTLIELLVVIVIIGILAAIVVFAVGGITDKGQKSSCSSDKRAIETAEEAYFAQPTDKGGGGGTYGDFSKLVPKFLAESSTLHTISLPTTTSYTIGDVSPCPGS